MLKLGYGSDTYGLQIPTKAELLIIGRTAVVLGAFYREL